MAPQSASATPSANENDKLAYLPHIPTRDEYQALLATYRQEMQHTIKGDDATAITARTEIKDYCQSCLKKFDLLVQTPGYSTIMLGLHFRWMQRREPYQPPVSFTVEQLVWITLLLKLRGYESINDIVPAYHLYYPELYLLIPNLPPPDVRLYSCELQTALTLLDEEELRSLILWHLKSVDWLQTRLSKYQARAKQSGQTFSNKFGDEFCDDLERCSYPSSHHQFMARFAHNLVIRGDLCVGTLSNSLIVAEKCAQSTQGNFLLQVSDNESDAALHTELSKLFAQLDAGATGPACLAPKHHYVATSNDDESQAQLDLCALPTRFGLALKHESWAQSVLRYTTTHTPSQSGESEPGESKLGKSKPQVRYYLCSLKSKPSLVDALLEVISYDELMTIRGINQQREPYKLRTSLRRRECPINKMSKELLSQMRILIPQHLGLPPIPNLTVLKSHLEHIPFFLIYNELVEASAYVP